MWCRRELGSVCGVLRVYDTGPVPAANETVRRASLRGLRALVTVFGPRRLLGWRGVCGLVAWLAARFAAGR